MFMFIFCFMIGQVRHEAEQESELRLSYEQLVDLPHLPREHGLWAGQGSMGPLFAVLEGDRKHVSF